MALDRLAVSLQTTTAAIFTGMMCIDLSFDLPVLQDGADNHLLRAHSYYAFLRGSSHMPVVVTSLMAVTGVSMVYSLFRRVTWRRLLSLASLASAAPFFMLKVEPSEDALLVPTLSREALTTHLTTIAQGHILLLGICVVNILLMITEPPRTIVKPKRA